MVSLPLFSIIISCLASFFSTFCFVPLCIFLARKIRLLDAPDGTIKKQSKAVPYLGGVAVYGGFLSGLLIGSACNSATFFLLIGVTPLLFLGLFDDIKPLRASQKFLCQLVIALCLLQIGIYWKEQFFHAWWSAPLFVLWVLVVVNAFNLVDVMDGLATTIALGALSSFLTVALLHNANEVIIPLVALGGSLIAFLWYNRPPARIYLGDAGSLWLGGFFALIPLFFSWSSYNEYGYITPVFILAIPLIEIAQLIIIRSYKGLPFYLGSPHHFCHYLLANRWSKQQILCYVAMISLILNIVACLFVQGIIGFPVLFAISGILASIWLVILVVPRK